MLMTPALSPIVNPNSTRNIFPSRRLQLNNDGKLQDYIGTHFQHHANGSITLTQPRMIEHFLAIVSLDSTDAHIKLRDTPANTILQDDPDRKPRLLPRV